MNSNHQMVSKVGLVYIIPLIGYLPAGSREESAVLLVFGIGWSSLPD